MAKMALFAFQARDKAGLTLLVAMSPSLPMLYNNSIGDCESRR